MLIKRANFCRCAVRSMFIFGFLAVADDLSRAELRRPASQTYCAAEVTSAGLGPASKPEFVSACETPCKETTNLACHCSGGMNDSERPGLQTIHSDEPFRSSLHVHV